MPAKPVPPHAEDVLTGGSTRRHGSPTDSHVNVFNHAKLVICGLTALTQETQKSKNGNDEAVLPGCAGNIATDNVSTTEQMPFVGYVVDTRSELEITADMRTRKYSG
jgi:hypothetical protein